MPLIPFLATDPFPIPFATIKTSRQALVGWQMIPVHNFRGRIYIAMRSFAISIQRGSAESVAVVLFMVASCRFFMPGVYSTIFFKKRIFAVRDFLVLLDLCFVVIVFTPAQVRLNV
mmetsp:Transcript_32034/g.41231  ORF Transcript_32034/g.41231 Transcript_32034/m.41231 type:complete len:116 (-) Transcript_32034:188-535(-)